MIKFDNKLELKYHFNDRSVYIDAMIRHRCEKEILYMLRTLADMLDIKMTVYSESFHQQENFRDIWSIAGESSRSISVLLNLFMQLWTRPSLAVGGQTAFNLTESEEEFLQKEIARLRHALKLKQPDVFASRKLVNILSGLPRFIKSKSNFFETMRGYPKTTKISLRELNTNNHSRSGSLEVKRDQFEYYILRSDDLPSIEDTKATIEIISPVLKDTRYRWKGIYNKGGEIIDFYMADEAFKQEMFDEKIAFKSGMCIDCVLVIQRKMSELGEIINVSYTVETVIRTRFDKMEILTLQGKMFLKKQEAEKRQLTFDFFG